MALLPWEPDPLSSTKRAYEIMSSPVVYFDPVMRVGDVVDNVCGNPHHGFPIVQGPTHPERFSYGTLIGLISAEHLGILLKERVSLSAIVFLSLFFTFFFNETTLLISFEKGVAADKRPSHGKR